MVNLSIGCGPAPATWILHEMDAGAYPSGTSARPVEQDRGHYTYISTGGHANGSAEPGPKPPEFEGRGGILPFEYASHRSPRVPIVRRAASLDGTLYPLRDFDVTPLDFPTESATIWKAHRWTQAIPLPVEPELAHPG